MMVDSSASPAILNGEPDATEYEETILHHDQATNATFPKQGPHKIIYSCFVPMIRARMSRRGEMTKSTSDHRVD